MNAVFSHLPTIVLTFSPGLLMRLAQLSAVFVGNWLLLILAPMLFEIITIRHPGKVCRLVVSFYTIYMVNDWLIFRIFYKRQSDHPMNSDTLILAVAPKHNSIVAFVTEPWFKYLANLSSVVVACAHYITKVANRVVSAPKVNWHWLPNFHAFSITQGGL